MNFRRLVLGTNERTNEFRMIFKRLKVTGVPPVFQGREKFQPCPILVGTYYLGCIDADHSDHSDSSTGTRRDIQPESELTNPKAQISPSSEGFATVSEKFGKDSQEMINLNHFQMMNRYEE